MKNLMIRIAAAALFVGMASVPVSAKCFADYKAKQQSPLQLHYGVIALADSICADRSKVEAEITDRISVGGWRLLNVMSVFGSDGLDKRKDSAGKFYLLY